jgi:hypothetical protein
VPEIIGESSQAELASNLLQAPHQKRSLVHPLLDRPKRVFDRFAAESEDIGAIPNTTNLMWSVLRGSYRISTAVFMLS